MHTLTATLRAAQEEASRTPHVRVEALDHIAGAPRPTLTRLYAGNEPDFYHDATCPADGSLVRARVTPENGGLYVQRVVNPGPSSDFSSWTLINSVSTASGISLVSRGATVNLFYVNASRRNLFRRESTDYGATWNSPVHVVYPQLSGIAWLAAAVSDIGVLVLFFASTNHDVYVTRRTGTTWSAPSLWTHNVASITGLSCVYHDDWNLVITGTEQSTNDAKVWTCVYGGGGAEATNTWSPLREVNTFKANSLTTFHFPSMVRPDVFRMVCTEKSTGSPAFERPVRSHSLTGSSFSDSLWREPVPFDLSPAYGVALAATRNHLWLSTPSGVWSGPLTNTVRDLTDDVLGVSLREGQESGEAVVVLRNDDGRYNGVGAESHPSLSHGAELRISPGYLTPAGRETSHWSAYWIESWEHRSSPGSSLFVIFAQNAWRLLEAWKARRQYTWDIGSTSVAGILEFVLARAGLETDASRASSDAGALRPAFTIHPGESWAGAVKRLLDRLPDVLAFRGHRGYLIHPQPSDAVDYRYGVGHPVLRGRYVSRAQTYNRVQAFGGAYVGEAFAWGEVDRLFDRVLQIHDLNLDTQQKAQDRAEAALREQLLASLDGEVVVPPNLGQELYDVIEVTDKSAGLLADRRRVLGLRLDYSRGPKPEYRHTIQLGGV